MTGLCLTTIITLILAFIHRRLPSIFGGVLEAVVVIQS